jgi:hypothetical protein
MGQMAKASGTMFLSLSRAVAPIMTMIFVIMAQASRDIIGTHHSSPRRQPSIPMEQGEKFPPTFSKTTLEPGFT